MINENKVIKVYIYCLVDPIDNLPKYIGKSKTPDKRLYEHIRRSSKGKTKKNSWIIYLLNNSLKPTMEIIDIVDINQCNFWESHYISLYKSWGFNLKNMTNGGDGFSDMSMETRKRISEAHRDCSGVNNPFFGKKHSEESLLKMRKKRHDDFGNMMSDIMKDKITSGTFTTIFKKGKENPSSKSVICKNKNGDIIHIYESIVDAKQDGFSVDCISKCIRGLNKTHKGFIFELKK